MCVEVTRISNLLVFGACQRWVEIRAFSSNTPGPPLPFTSFHPDHTQFAQATGEKEPVVESKGAHPSRQADAVPPSQGPTRTLPAAQRPGALSAAPVLLTAGGRTAAWAERDGAGRPEWMKPSREAPLVKHPWLHARAYFIQTFPFSTYL